MNIEKAKILDDILRRFKGNVTITWTDLHNELGQTREYFLTENNIRYLLGDGMLTEDKTNQRLCLSDKGFATYTDIDTLGYVTKFKKEKRDNLIRYIGFGITVATFGLLLIRTLSGTDKATLSSLTVSDSIPNGETKNNQNDFDIYLNTLPQISIPTNLELSTDGERYDYGEFKKFKTRWSDKPFGKLYETKDKVVTVDITVASILVPVFVVYDRQGNILDALNVFKKPEMELDFETVESLYVDTKEIRVYSTTTTWKLNDKKTDRVAGSETITRDTVVYTIDDKGKFRVKV